MSWRREFSKLQWLFRRKEPTSDLEEEIRLHIRMEEQENVEGGMSPEEAKYAARRRFGNVTLAREESSETWGWHALQTVAQDIRFALRQLRQNPGFAAVAVVTLALGIGANTAIFSIVYSVLLRPLPFQNPDRLVNLFETEVSSGDYPLSGADYLDWQAQNRTLAGTSLYSWSHPVSASGAIEPETALVVSAQANFFSVLGVQPFAGRPFAPGEDAAGKNHVAILSYGFWQRHFGGEANAIGKAVTLNGESYTVIGIMPHWFNFPATTDLWTPLDMSPKELGPRGNHNWSAIARLKTGVTLGQARADLLGISRRLEKQYPNSNNNVHAVLTPMKDILTGDSRKPLLVLLGAVMLVLLIACVNVANLQLARASSRHREMAVRASLGAGRWRLVRQLLTESVLLALAGAMLGTLSAWWCVRLLESAKNVPIPRENAIQIDAAVLAFTIAVSVIAGILFGLAPARQLSQVNCNEELKAGAQAVLSPGGTRSRFRNALVVGEIALTLALLAGAGLLLRSFAHLRSADLGVNPHNVLTMVFNLPEAKYNSLSLRRQFFDQLVDRANHTPGIVAATVSTEIPLVGGSNGYLKVDDNSDPALSTKLVGWNWITPDYFRTFQIPLHAGRGFTSADIDRAAQTGTKLFDVYRAATASGTPLKVPPDLALVAVISRGMARTFWHNKDPVGRSFHWNDVKVTVIGVVGDVREYGIRQNVKPQAYFPYTLVLPAEGYARLTLRTHVPPLTVLPAIRHHVDALDSTLAIVHPTTMEDLIASDTQDTTIQAFLLGTFAVLALVLATVGLYGVMSYIVTQRTREIGIRMAVGVRRTDVLRLVLKQGALLTLSGVTLGLFAALVLTRLLSSLLYGVASTDPLTFACVALLLGFVALAAHYLPGLRATRIDPITALRYE
jgi:putative ABC transport system permease protein